jgi:hypothetical protein
MEGLAAELAAGEEVLPEGLPKGLPEGLPEGFGKPSASAYESYCGALVEIFEKGMAERDQAAGFVGLPNFLRYNLPENPNVVKSYGAMLDLIPECELKKRVIQRVRDAISGLGPAFRESLPKGFGEPLPKSMPNPEHEHEHEHEPKNRLLPSENGNGKHESESPIVLEFPCAGKSPKVWHLRESKVAEYQSSYPGVDVLAECRMARQWCTDNPPKRKTAKGMPAFLTRWLSKAQNGRLVNGTPRGSPLASENVTRIRSNDYDHLQ